MKLSLNELEEQIVDAGYKLTFARKSITDIFLRYNDSQLTAEDFYKLINDSHEKIGIATIYRTLSLLTELGILSKLNLDDTHSRYELKNEGVLKCYMVCKSCGQIIGVQKIPLYALFSDVNDYFEFEIDSMNIIVKGLCASCHIISK
ncbi:transcriptional repressor [Acidaminobacter sp. JC074]|uniref:Fur family transcriptional regulator n=1 Tax=Acidaminobacter sp. JC074 TaxID=2530199 RepID=UPI001F0DE587|nr:Fur family transcriptional regulator [Acidaminobacter sp. JC074]MCH4888385.1 transcriptional repressor [Acidaminobacter sp. JC074]